MTQIVVAQRMWQRRDTAGNWTAVNPVLAAGEIGVELGATPEDTQFKIGTGSRPWNDLPYFSGGGGEPVEMRATATHIQWRQVGEPVWIDLVPLSEITGADGEDGDPVELRVTGTHIQWRWVGGGAWFDLIALASLAGPPGPASSAYLGAAFDGGAGVIQEGAFADVRVPYGFTISKASLLVDPAGSITIDVLNTPFASAPPTAGDSICSGNPPSISSGQTWEDGVLSGWDTAIDTGSVFRFIVLSASGVRKANILIEGVRA